MSLRTATVQSSASAARMSHPVERNLHSTLEQGLGVTSTKIGPGDKEEAYAMGKTRVRWMLTAIIAALILLSILVGIYAGLFNDERLRRMFQEKKAQEKIGEEKVDAVRLGIAIHQQEAEREHQEYDTKRALKRIISVIGRKFDELIDEAKTDTTFDSKKFDQKLKESKSFLTSFVNDELKDFEKEKRAYDLEAKKRLEKLAVAQEQSLRELLKSVSGVKMGAMEEMIEEVFAAGQKAPNLEVSDQAVEEIESLADALYEGKIDLQKGRQRLDTIRLQIVGQLPEDITSGFTEAKTADDFAQVLDDLVETTKLARGKKEIAAIEETWRKNIDKAREQAQNDDNTDDDDVYDEEIKLNVDAILAIQRLVAEGKVPVYLLDFEAIDMKDLQDSENDDDNENNDQDDQQQNQDDQPQGDDQEQQGEDEQQNQDGQQQDGEQAGEDEQQQQDAEQGEQNEADDN